MILLATAILVILGLIFGGWGTVYAAQDSEPDDLLYPVKVAVDYLDELFTIVESPEDPSAIGVRAGDQIHLRDQDQDQTKLPTIAEEKQYRYRIGNEFSDDDNIEPILDDTITMTPTITATQTMSGSLWSWGPGPFEYRLGYTHTYTNGLEYKLGYTHTFTNSMELEGPPFSGDPPLGDPGSSTDPPAPANLGPGEPPAKEVQEPSENKGTTGEQQKGGK